MMRFFFAFACLLWFGALHAQPEFTKYLSDEWVEAQMAQLTPDERIAQLMMVAGYSEKGAAHLAELQYLVDKYGIGGIIFFKGGPQRQAKMINHLQSRSKVPLMISIDGEWGVSMRLDSTITYPFQMTLGAIQNDSLLYQMGQAVARQCRRVGVHVNFAPVVDVNNNPDNPVISFRSFGEDRVRVAKLGIAYMKGMQDGNVMANAKHFPGHGDTDTDSHLATPVIKHSRQRLDSIELYPFRELIKAGVGSMMVAHIHIPALDATAGLPTTLSKKVVTDLLQTELGFQGLIFTDALNMKGVASLYGPGKVDVKAVLAGNDALLFTESVAKAIAEIKAAIARGEITQEEIDRRCRKILAAKRWLNLHQLKPIELAGLHADLNTASDKALVRKLYEHSLTAVKNENGIMPVKNLAQTKIATISIGSASKTTFQRTIDKYAKATHFQLPKAPTNQQLNDLRAKLKGYDLVLVGLHQVQKMPYNNNAYSDALNIFIGELASNEKSIIAVFRNPYTIAKIDFIDRAEGLLLAYQDNITTQDLAAQAIFGAVGAKGKLPVSIGNKFQAGEGISLASNGRLQYVAPADIGIDGDWLQQKIDSIANFALEQQAMPGMQILAAKDGKVFFHQAYGYHTYDTTRPVQLDDLYDLASVTKITASTLGLMKLYDEGKIDLDAPLSKYWRGWQGTGKKDLIIRDILTHQARLRAWFPFWKRVVGRKGRYNTRFIQADSSAQYSIKLRDSLFLSRDYPLKIYSRINHSWLQWKKGYEYSDLSFYLYPALVQQMKGLPFEQYMRQTFYGPIGAYDLCYNPYKSHPLSRIVPTEIDTFFRQRPIHGYVHDEGAIMMGGISGHAGHFGTANDLAKYLQLLLNGGSYGDAQLLRPSTIYEFTRYQFAQLGNRRGLGFDKALLANRHLGTPAPSASDDSFGHTGFTGTFIWADPTNGLLFVFLSNRVYPTRNNKKIGQLNIRPSLHEAFYEAIRRANR